jgi:uncharacterized damage-inducible protein DinB
MNIAQSLLAEMDHEMASTRKELERVPEDKFDWAPHPKSAKMGKLAQHLAMLPSWTKETMTKDSLELGSSEPPPPPKSRKEILDLFDQNCKVAKEVLASAKDEEFFKPWSLKMKGQVLMTMPKIVVMRNFVMNHNVHHRAQLGVYLRLNDVAVPSIYGPSADENPFG